MSQKDPAQHPPRLRRTLALLWILGGGRQPGPEAQNTGSPSEHVSLASLCPGLPWRLPRNGQWGHNTRAWEVDGSPLPCVQLWLPARAAGLPLPCPGPVQVIVPLCPLHHRSPEAMFASGHIDQQHLGRRTGVVGTGLQEGLFEPAGVGSCSRTREPPPLGDSKDLQEGPGLGVRGLLKVPDCGSGGGPGGGSWGE